MVSAAEKPVTKRTAIACGTVHMLSSTAHALRSQANPKGDPIEVARLAGIMAAKRTGELIPLCHPLQLDHVDVRISLASECANIEATVVCHGRTGVEMEALTAVTVAALTIYDMCKAIDRNMVIGDICLMKKAGGRSGIYRRKVE
jgi:cyclic pyranopterin phosphate synthase